MRGGGGGGGGGGGRSEAGLDGFPTPARVQGSRGGKYLPLRGREGGCGGSSGGGGSGGGGGGGAGRRLPVVGLEVVKLVELEADVLDGELEQVPEACQVLGAGPRVGAHILPPTRDTRHHVRSSRFVCVTLSYLQLELN